MMREELIPAWNGSLERAGLCPGLSTYTGPSILSGAIVPKHSPMAERPVSGQDSARILRLHVGPILPTPGMVRDQIRRGRTVNAIARKFGCSQAVIRRLRDAWTQDTLRRQGRLFESA